jgi:hypothetical protein
VHVADRGAELVPGVPVHGVLEILSRPRVAAVGVRPHAGPGTFRQGSARDQDPSGPVAQIAGEGEVQGRPIGVDIAPCGGSRRFGIHVEEHHEVSWHHAWISSFSSGR